MGRGRRRGMRRREILRRFRFVIWICAFLIYFVLFQLVLLSSVVKESLISILQQLKITKMLLLLYDSNLDIHTLFWHRKFTSASCATSGGQWYTDVTTTGRCRHLF